MAGTIERVLSLKLVGNTKDLDKDMSKTRKGVGKLGKAVAGLAVVGIGALTVATIEGIKAFREEQDIIRSFNRTVKNLNLPVQNATRVMDRMADRAVNLGFDDAETIQGMNTFLKLTGSIGRAAELTGLAMDIARSRNISLTEAQRIAIGVYNGSARSLRLYGIEGKKGMEAVAEARRQERGQAREWARNHPFLVTIGKVNDTWADLVGNLSQGNFKGAQEAFDKLGRVIRRALFGFTDKDTGKRVKGLVDKLGDWGRDIANGILEGIGKVDWGKTLSDTLNRALGLLGEAAKNGTLTNIAVVGGAIAAGIFAIDVFIKAASAVFTSPRWLLGAGSKAAGAMVGLAFRGAMFVADLFLSAAAAIFAASRWAVTSAVGLAASAAGALMGIAFRTGMFVLDLFVSLAASVFSDLAANVTAKVAATAAGAAMGTAWRTGMFATQLFLSATIGLMGRIRASRMVLSAATLLGQTFGFRIAGGVLGVLTGAWFIGEIANALYNAGGLNKVDEAIQNHRPLPNSPFIWPWSPGGLFNPNRDDGRTTTGRFATGTAGAPRGWSWVGERGPELVKFRGGEQVRDASRSARMAGGSTVVNVNMSVPPTADRAAIGKTVMDAIDAALARGHRFRYAPVGGNR